jgi:hypothetical protein
LDLFTCFYYFQSHIQNSGIVQLHNAAIGPGFHMDAATFAVSVIVSAKIITNSLYRRPILSAMTWVLPEGRLSLILRNSLKVIVLVMTKDFIGYFLPGYVIG